jgi:O-antigen/teichoic acid export membrane protein
MKDGEYKPVRGKVRDTSLSIKKYWLKLTGYGALWLIAATLLTKLIGILQKIPLQNLAGDSVFGIYNIVYPIYQMMMALGIAGIPTALASYIAGQERHERERTLVIALMVSGVAALFIGLLTLAFAPLLGKLIGYEEVASSLRVLALALFVTPIIAVYRGYYQGIDDARTSSISQLIEQLVRVTCMVLLLWIGLKLEWKATTMSSAVMWGSVIGAVATLLWFWKHKPNMVRFAQLKPAWRYEATKLLQLALPTALAAIVVPMVAVVDSFTIPRLLGDSGLGTADVMSSYGQYSRIQPLIQLVSMLLAALAAGFLPRWVQQARSGNSEQLLGKRLLLIHRIAWLISCGAAAGLYFLAEPINIMLYKDNAGVETFRLLALTTVASSLLAVQAPLLQGAGITKLAVWLLLIAAGGKAVLNMVFVPQYGIEGAAFAANASLLLPACIGSWMLYRAAGHMQAGNWRQFAYRELLSPLLVVVGGIVAMCVVLYWLEQVWWLELMTRLDMTFYTVAMVAAGAIVYGLTLVVTSVVRRDEWQHLG